jgi:hypothetical protein
VEHILDKLRHEEISLGAHTSIVSLSKDAGFRHVWYQRTTKPFGMQLGLQCPDCGRLRCFRVKYDTYDRFTVSCKNEDCTFASTFSTSQTPLKTMQGNVKEGWGKETLWDSSLGSVPPSKLSAI